MSSPTLPGRAICFFLGLAGVFLHTLSARAQGPPPATASVQIVNATSVPAIALRINDGLAYQSFPQGLKSADAPTATLKAIYEAEDRRTGQRVKSREMIYQPGTHQSLVILGDFATDSPRGSLRRPGRALEGDGEQYPPNILFNVFSHETKESPVRLRVINGMPGRNLIFVAGEQEISIEPGTFAVLNGQPSVAQYRAKTDGEEIVVLMRQEGVIRNAMVVFFLKEGRPAFMRAFENNAESKRRAKELETERE